MSFEVALVVGSILAVLSGVSVLTAMIDGRKPRVASVVVVIAGGLLLWSAAIAPDGLQISDLPRAYFTVIGAILN